MAKTSLRAYDREIESFIEQNQLEQAIAHAKHILKFYPKHIQTYRLLGKAYLESQRYGDAADVFQRVLSAIPDDFVSHVGMSIIREDEGNLDVAIWHMERAFEIQPANSAIQGELRRLYGKRDGVEPPKVRLTRGALARMYMKGELYQQAIAELRAALAEDPQRPDLLAMLAPAYFLSGQRVEAADTCSTLLKKTPYCLEANRILAEILGNTERSQEAQMCRQRVHALDPYAAQLSPAAPSPELVADNAVSLERLVWSPGQPITGLPGQPEWASSLGLDLGEQAEKGEEKPDWLVDETAKTRALAEETPSPETVPPFAASVQPTETEEPSQEQEDQIPDWMKTAGWGPSISEAEEPPTILEDSGIKLPEEGEIEQAEIPEWLQAIAPPQPTVEGESPDQLAIEPGEEIISEGSDALSWLEETPPGPTDSVATWLDEQAPETPEIPRVEEGIEDAGEVPDWLKDLGPAEPATPQESGAVELGDTAQAQDEMDTHELPGWVASGGQAAEETPAEELPDWLKPETGQPSAEIEPEQPEWLTEAKEEAWQPVDEMEPQAVVPSPEEKPEAGSEDDEAFAWLESLAAKQGADEALLLTPEERREAPPEWILEAARAEAETTKPAELPEDETAVPDWLQEGEPTVEPTSKTEEADEGEIPEWLSEFESLATEEGELTPDAQAAEVAPQEFDIGEIAVETPLDQPSISEEELPEPEPEPGELPDWLRELPETPEEEVETGLPVTFDEAVEMPSQDLAEAPLEPVRDSSEAEAAELPDWLQEMEEAPAAEIPTAQEGLEGEEVLPIEPEAAPEEELPDWLMESEQQVSTTEGITQVSPAAELPDWLTQTEEETHMEMLFGPQVMSDVEAEAVEEPLPVDETSEPISDTQPTRVQPAAIVEEPPEVEAPLPATAPLSHEVPDWVKELDREEELAQQSAISAEEEGAVPSDEEAAFAWLEGLATRMGAEEALLLTPEERTEEPPEWITRAAEEADELPEEAIEAEEFTPLDTAIPEESTAEGLGEEYVSEQPVEDLGLPEPGEAILEEEPPPAVTFEGQAPVEEERLPVESELEALLETPAEELQLPTSQEPLESMEMAVEEEMVEAEIPAEIEEMPKTFEPELGLTEEGAQPSIEQEVPPELPSWLADVDKAESLPEEEEWLPPEEAQLEAALTPEFGVESVEPVEAEAEQLDVNQAGLAELERLPGVGFTRAQAVLAYRQEYGPLSNLDKLVNVPGFDTSLVESLRSQLTTGEVSPVEPILEGMDTHQVTLIQARNALAQGESSQALAHYVTLIKSKQLLPDVIQDLNEALYRFPVDISIWEALGDAHMRSGRLQDALDAYTKAEELIR